MKNPNNKLGNETSPYLLQHASNPVNWYPWGAAALEKARTENKPILLSIGYSACHWCHVMAHESFEDNDIAAIMNQHFINIKVDREERPDLDKIYQTAHSLLTSRAGGWPLTVFLSPDNQVPFFAGTYFPDKKRYNMPAFPEIMKIVTDAFLNKKADIKQQNNSVISALNNVSGHFQSTSDINSLPLDLARKQLKNAFDSQHGGFSAAPKFPHPGMIERCLQHYLLLRSQNKNDKQALHMATFTLDKMALGGFYDQMGGGFFRYSTDEFWMIPHFEKMLYDNAQLFALYAQASLMSASKLYRKTLTLAADWLIREMQTAEGGYCSALDADTENIEGKTYTWDPQQIKQALTKDEYTVFTLKYDLSRPANFEGDWHLHSTQDNVSLANTSQARKLKLDIGQIETSLESARLKLLNIRNTRTQPARDDKILCSWNALMIRGMSLAGRHSNTEQYIDSAIQSVDFIYSTLWKNKRLLASYKDGKAHLNAYLDDYAYLLQALIELLQAQWSSRNYSWAIEIADCMLDYFEDREQGGFFFTSHDHEKLLYRSKTFSDDAMPSGNAVAATALLQLSLLTGEHRYMEAAEKTIRCSYDALSQQAATHCSLLHALNLYLKPAIIIVLRGTDEHLIQWQKITNSYYIPNLICIAINNDTAPPDSLKDKVPHGDICAYICEGTTCLPTIKELPDFENYIKSITFYDHH
ncbi:Uncharacterized protein YyaL [hydrothermal vent metagenome]|uniref:Uncharacterized protein YyaL n=1 Tax=hydrothermal vent metagenome TaxID=652676 RepID=A0A3B0XH21_9ZZZZ